MHTCNPWLGPFQPYSRFVYLLDFVCVILYVVATTKSDKPVLELNGSAYDIGWDYDWDYLCLLFYILAAYKVITGHVPTCDSAHMVTL